MGKYKKAAAMAGAFLLGAMACVPAYGGEWKHDGTGWWYQHEDGTYLADQYVEIDKKYYGFDSNGYMATGWCQIDGEWYYFKPDGVSVRGGWVEGKYYMDDDGTMLAGAVTPDGYYVGEDGVWQEKTPESEDAEEGAKDNTKGRTLTSRELQ